MEIRNQKRFWYSFCKSSEYFVGHQLQVWRIQILKKKLNLIFLNFFSKSQKISIFEDKSNKSKTNKARSQNCRENNAAPGIILTEPHLSLLNNRSKFIEQLKIHDGESTSISAVAFWRNICNFLILRVHSQASLLSEKTFVQSIALL